MSNGFGYFGQNQSNVLQGTPCAEFTTKWNLKSDVHISNYHQTKKYNLSTRRNKTKTRIK
ncbi:MAG: hypothetical protein OEX19_11385, partial [Gammaproteobacteria bacterium]|nr:hypothetical protein [Gammaproteobacteria bacterium]